MRILVVSNLYPPNAIGGYEVLCSEVGEALAAGGHAVTVLTSCFGGRPAEGRPVVVHQALQLLVSHTIYEPFSGSPALRRAMSGGNLAAFRHALDIAKPDVVFCWNLHGLDLEFLEGVCAAPVPTVVMLTDNWLASMLNPNFVAEYFRRGVYAPAGESLPFAAGRPAVKRSLAATAIFGSEFMRDFHAAAGLRFSSERVIHNGVALAPGAPLAERLPIGAAGDVRLLFAGRIVEAKGAHVALEALARLRAERPCGLDFSLTLVGDARDADYVARLRRIAEQADCHDRLRLLDTLPQDELPTLFASHDIYLFPSLYEPFSLTLIHALAAGIPTVASRVGGNAEIVVEGETGLLTDRNDSISVAAAVARLCADPTLVRRLIERAPPAAARFSIQRMVGAMEHYLKAVAA